MSEDLVQASRAWIESLKCPSCGGDGIRAVMVELGVLEPEQCQWCYEKWATLRTPVSAERSPTQIGADLKAALEGRPRSSYTPLTVEQIDRVRSVYKRHFSDGERLDTVCDMAINCLLYAEEIQRLRSDAGRAVENHTADLSQSSTVAESKWIPVSERLPTEPRDQIICLAYTPESSDGDKSVPGAFAASYDDGEWTSRMDTGCWEPGEVTHWMQFPEGPK